MEDDCGVMCGEGVRVFPDGEVHYGDAHRSLLCRDNGPAMVWACGRIHFYEEGHSHRTEGPATYRPRDGSRLYSLDGVRMRYATYIKEMENQI